MRVWCLAEETFTGGQLLLLSRQTHAPRLWEAQGERLQSVGRLNDPRSHLPWIYGDLEPGLLLCGHPQVTPGQPSSPLVCFERPPAPQQSLWERGQGCGWGSAVPAGVLTGTLTAQGLCQAAAAADGHEGPAEELRRLPQAAQLAVVAALHQGGSGGASP